MADTVGKVGKDFLNNLREKIQKGEFNSDNPIVEGEGSVEIPKDITPEQLQELLESLKGQLGSEAGAAGADLGFGAMPGYAIHPAIFFAAFVILFTIIGWFSYKLVHSLKEKERKKEEKKKLKELKKKK